MSEYVRYEVTDGIARLSMDNPPLNVLGQRLRASLFAAFQRAASDPEVRVILLTALGGSWPVGGDIREFDGPVQSPSLPELLTLIYDLDKPVIAALHGQALGGGLELALAASARVAERSATFALPEVKLGLMPGAGGTQRLPRLIGAKAALEMILTGAEITADRAHQIGLVDLVVGGDVAAAARDVAVAHRDGQNPLPVASRRRMPGLEDRAGWLAAVEEERSRPVRPENPVPKLAVDAVEAALLLPPDQGLVLERAGFEELLRTPQSRALRHMFFAERNAARAAALGAERPLQHVAVVGAGAVGTGLAALLLQKGLAVSVVESDRQMLSVSLARIARHLEQAVKAARMTEAEAKAAWEHLRAAAQPKPMSGADLVIEAVTEDWQTKMQALQMIDSVTGPDCPVLTVTCSLSAAALAEASGRGGRHGAVFITTPVRRTKVMELITGAGGDPVLLGSVRALARLLDWRVLRGLPDDRAGFLTKRLWTGLFDAADRCLALGATPQEVDRATHQMGLRFGPYEWRDFFGAGHDILTTPLRHERVGAEPLAAAFGDWLVAAGYSGRRARQGYHSYSDKGRLPQIPPAIVSRLAELRPPRVLPPPMLHRRLIGGLANVGAWALVDGVARCPSDIDLAALALGFPRWQGGPMHCADAAGLLLLRDDLRDWAKAGDPFWTPAPLWDELIKEGRSFADLNGA
ncbi:MAG: enoyl-CoA hydratase-related protein [Paracoccaceae bacterium]